MADNPDQIEELDEEGFPRGVKAKLNEAIRAINLLLGTEYKFDTSSLAAIVKTHDSQGKRIVTMPRGALGSQSTRTTPFELIDVSANGSNNIRIVYGTLNGIEPDGMVVGDNPPFVFNGVSDSGRAWAEIDFTISSGLFSITGRSLNHGSTVPTDDLPSGDGDGSVYRQLGNWSKPGDNLSIAQDVEYSLIMELCGGVTVLWGPG